MVGKLWILESSSGHTNVSHLKSVFSLSRTMEFFTQ